MAVGFYIANTVISLYLTKLSILSVSRGQVLCNDDLPNPARPGREQR